MASGFRAASKHSSARSLGSFVDVTGSAASSDFEPVELEAGEEGELSQGESDTSSGGRLQPPSQGGMLGKTMTPQPAAGASLRSVPEQSEIKASPEPAGAGAAFPEPLQEVQQNIENATQKAAELAKEFTSKLLGGGAEASKSVYRLAGDVSNWWAALDPGAAPRQESPQGSARSARDSGELQAVFGLPETEGLLEKFQCSLVQSLECRHNAFCKPQQARFVGRMYVTDANTCFSAEGVRFAIPHADVRRAAKQAQDGAGALRLEFGGEGQFVLFEFQGGGLDSALGLLEHVTEA